MALVAYSDSEASDSEPETTTTKKPTSTAPPPPPSTATTTTTTSSTTPKPFQVDRSNPRKIRVALPDLKPDPSTSTNEDTDGPARKKPRIGGGGGGGAFAGFNALLPAPKKPAATPKPSATGSTRKVFSLKTGATPGFDRQADAEMRSEMAFGRLGGEDETIPKAGSLRGDNDDILGGGEGGQGKNEDSKANTDTDTKPPQEVKLKGNPMMFKPLSVGRGTQGRGKRKAGPIAVTGSGGASGPVKKDLGGGSSAGAAAGAAPPIAAAAPAPAPPKPKISLFSLSSSTEETVTAPAPAPAAYEPLVYTSNQEATAPAGPEPASAAAPELTHSSYPPPSTTTGKTTLGAIADDLNLTRAQRRQLFGRSADPSGTAATAAAPRILHFNTDQEYAANQQMAHEDLAAAQHNPVRAIAPGKHTLQQLVSAASTQREALEESFATGRRNKKEAGSKYGW